MPTPRERNALIFIAALGALGVGVRAFFAVTQAGTQPTRESRVALDRQIGAVDSAAAFKRQPGGPRSKGRRKVDPSDTVHLTGRSGAAASSVHRIAPKRARGSGLDRGTDAPADSAVVDPLAKYEARRQAVARANQAVQARIDRERAATLSPPDTPLAKTRPRYKKAGKKRPGSASPVRP